MLSYLSESGGKVSKCTTLGGGSARGCTPSLCDLTDVTKGGGEGLNTVSNCATGPMKGGSGLDIVCGGNMCE